MFSVAFRLFVALPVSTAVVLGLFTFMAWMVDNGQQRAPEQSQILAFDMVMVEQERDAQRRQRALPEKPDTPEPPPEALPTSSQSVTATPAPAMPNLALDTTISGLAINVPQFSDFGANQQAMPLYRIEPRYPARAIKKGAEGFVVLSFTIDPQGRPTDINVLDAKPRRLFEKEAIRALRKWKYQAKVVDRKAIAQVGQTVRLEFKLNK
ncbi:energy transducer TonB [Photobacterium sp.]|uniref:energy transducer TonB n=1 Tax=Photobacterium sp. TaxID=660 RepID=UPI00299DE629|nr:energy transducer TonB [Photobacterium sp.]MDX1303525.1 energy transducer TonB [Photobacterium sp.]